MLRAKPELTLEGKVWLDSPFGIHICSSCSPVGELTVKKNKGSNRSHP